MEWGGVSGVGVYGHTVMSGQVWDHGLMHQLSALQGFTTSLPREVSACQLRLLASKARAKHGGEVSARYLLYEWGVKSVLANCSNTTPDAANLATPLVQLGQAVRVTLPKIYPFAPLNFVHEPYSGIRVPKAAKKYP